MRQVLWLEPLGGIAGDMFLAAALDLGVDVREVERALGGLGLSGWRLVVTRAARHGIVGTHVDVEVDPASTETGHGRTLSQIRGMIERCETMSPTARGRALRLFQVLAEAEGAVHGIPTDQVHFHEVGAVDSIVDACAAAVVLDLLGDPEVRSAPPPLGSGIAKTEHGQIPIPAPATLELLRGVPVRFEGTGELTTPTGAAILRAFAEVGPIPQLWVRKVGYGVGTRDPKDRANVLRATLGEIEEAIPAPTGAPETVAVLEANLDDCSPQLLGALVEQLLEDGALDAFIAPVTMKKSRPGHLLTVLCAPERRAALTERVLAESTTLGVRHHLAERTVLERTFEPVSTPYGTVRMKLGLRHAKVVNAQPEFDDCVRLAKERGVPVKAVWQAAIAAYRG